MSFDVVIRNRHLVDGAGNPWFKADMGIKDGKIVEVSRTGIRGDGRIIDADEMVVCPGFIDIHNHSDFTLLANPRGENFIHQGATTLVIGNCGYSYAPVSDEFKEDLKGYVAAMTFGVNPPITWHSCGEFMEKLEESGLAVNVCSQVDHGTLRIEVMGFATNAPTEDEMNRMKILLDQSFEDGVFSFSTGLSYSPGSESSTDELVELCKVVAKHGGVYSTHIRYGGAAFREAVEIAEKTGVSVEVSHYTGVGVDEARARGLDITFDAYPYDVGMGLTNQRPPAWCW